jgi:tRNA pseudouridine32 synthase/23S rRNA pseudouridine746 synthase
LTIPILFADDALIVVDKPAGMLSVPGRGEDKRDCAAARVQSLYPEALVVHRLDMATSGLLLLARGASVQRRLSIAFARREVGKRYVAVVRGRVQAPCTDIDLPLAADWPNRPKQKVDIDGGKPSRTRCRLLAFDAGSDTSRVELEPLTGRSHQLRVHLLAIGHPIVGDTLYGAAPAARLLLHASGLSLRHPVHGEAMRFESEPPF